MKFEVSQLTSEITSSLQQPIHLSVKAGETLCISGASGIGKSVLLRCLADLVPHTGKMSLNGESSLTMSADQWRRRVCLLPAESQWWYVSVGEHFKGNQSNNERVNHVVDRNIESEFEQSCFRQLDFKAEVLQWRIDRLSTGEKQRLSLLRVLHKKPEVLLLDEPFSNLDPTSRFQLKKILKELQEKKNMCMLISSHDLNHVTEVCRRIVVLHEGEIVHDMETNKNTLKELEAFFAVKGD